MWDLIIHATYIRVFARERRRLSRKRKPASPPVTHKAPVSPKPHIAKALDGRTGTGSKPQLLLKNSVVLSKSCWSSGSRTTRRWGVPSSSRENRSAGGTRDLGEPTLVPTTCGPWHAHGKPDRVTRQAPRCSSQRTNAGPEYMVYFPSANPIVGWPGSTKKPPDLALGK